MKFIPTPQKRRALTVSLILIVTGIISFMFSASGIVPPLFLQLVSLGCISAGTYIAVRFCITEITYILRDNEGKGEDVYSLPRESIDFCITKAQGKREPVTECLLSLDKLIRIDELTDGYLAALRREYPALKLFYYTVSMLKDKRFALVFEDKDDVYCIVVEDCDNLIATLSAYMA